MTRTRPVRENERGGRSGRVRLVWAGWGVFGIWAVQRWRNKTPKSSFTLNAIKLGLKIYSEQDM